MSVSIAQELATLDPDGIGRRLGRLTQTQAMHLLYDWRFWARPAQVEPEGEWSVWACIAGRGFGKTKAGSETVRKWIEQDGVKRIALVAQTKGDARDVMIEGDSGLLAVSPPWNPARYYPSKRLIVWPNYGAKALIFSGDEPNQLRGPQFERAWLDEFAKFRYPEECWDNLEMGLRLGNPKAMITTTPRPLTRLREILEDPDTAVTTGSTFDNLNNLAAKFVKRMMRRYAGTRIGRQELFAEMLREVEGALWTSAMIEKLRCLPADVPKDLLRVTVNIDPAVSTNEDSNETGITVTAKAANDHGYLLAEQSGVFSPGQWGSIAVQLYDKYEADAVVGEVNNGGDLVEHTVKTVRSSVNFVQVRATRGKAVRAAPVAALYEQGRIHHVGQFAELEDQMLATTQETYTGSGSPDRMDSAIWGFTDNMLDPDTDWESFRFRL